MGAKIEIGMPTLEQVKKSIIMLDIERIEAKKRDYTRIKQIMNILGKAGKDAQDRLVISFRYDDDPREISDIPEVKAYVRKIYEKWPHFLYFIPKDHQSAGALLTCLCAESVVTETGTEIEFSEQAMRVLDSEIVDYAKSVGDENPVLISSMFQYQ